MANTRRRLSLAIWSAIAALFLSCGTAKGQNRFPAPFPSDAAKLTPSVTREFLELLCPGKVITGAEPGCPCPDRQDPGSLTIVSVLYGHLLAPNSDDVLVQTEGCEPHAAGFGGTAIFTRTPGGWAVGRPYSGGPEGWCRRIANPQGRDGLLCFNEGHWAEGTSLGWLTFGYETREQYEAVKLASVTDTTDNACEAALLGRPSRPAVKSQVDRVSLERGRSGRLVMTLYARCQRGLLSPRSLATCRPESDLPDVPLNPSGPLNRYRIVYVFDGKQFEPTAAGKAAAAAMAQCVNESYE